MICNIFLLCVILLLVARCQKDSASDEEIANTEELCFPDFPSFMVSYRQYKKDLAASTKAEMIAAGSMQKS